MIPAPFAYVAPSELETAIQLLQQSDGEARVLAGGHSLLPMMKLRLARPDLLVDLRRLSPQLRYVREGDGSVAIGALTTHADIEFDSLLARLIPFMGQAARTIADPLVRSCGTFGGSLAHVDPFGDWPAIALALGAEVQVIGPGGERKLEVDELIRGPYTTSLETAEIIAEIRCPALEEGAAGAYVKHGRHGDSDFAVVGCCAVLRGSTSGARLVRVAFSGLSSTPHRDRGVEDSLIGIALDSESIAAAAARAGVEIEPMDDAYASKDFRRHLARVLCRRALTLAAQGLYSER